jgi:hypothetical protein
MNAELHSLLIKYTDTQDLVGATIGEISFIVMLTSLGCLLGSSAVGLLMDMIRRSELYCGTGTYVNVIFLFNLYAHSFKVGRDAPDFRPHNLAFLYRTPYPVGYLI